MTPSPNLTISRNEIGRNCCALHRQQKPRCEKIYSFSGSRTKDEGQIKSPCFRTCLTFCFKDQRRMEQRESSVDSHAEGTEGRLKDLTSKWFIDTQVPLIVHNGFFPSWFLGFITRKDAEEILKEKELGCFLIRLSDKAIGYILSYKGRDRFRHFVINQEETGQFVVCGDTEGHDTVSDLIEYYKTSPIQPFGEYLTYPCFEPLSEELYDIIQVCPKEKPVVMAREPKNGQPPTRPPKSNRTQEEGPPLPRRSRNLDSGLHNNQDNVLYAQLMKQSPRETPRSKHSSKDNSPDNSPRRPERFTTSTSQDLDPKPNSVYSELSRLDSKSRSLPLLDASLDTEQSYRLSAPPDTPPRLSPRTVRQVTSYGPQTEKSEACGSRPRSSHSLEHMNAGAVYHLAGRTGGPHTTSSDARSLASEHHSESVYAEVPGEGLAGRLAHVNTYEMLPHEDEAKSKNNSNTYEPLEDIRSKTSTWGLKNDKWKWLFPEVKRKW